jgi:putative DNA primase/helicase
MRTRKRDADMKNDCPERAAMHDFLTALFPAISPNWLLLWGLPSKQSMFIQDLTPEVLAKLHAWAQLENVYVGVGLRDKDYGPNLRGGRDTIVAIPGVCLDIDIQHEVHTKPKLAPSQEAAMKLIEEMGPPPAIVIHTGHGLQAWWLFPEPLILDTPAERHGAEELAKAWNSTARTRAHQLGLDVDQVGDLARVMRPPGTWNRKAAPCPVKVLVFDNDRRYQPSELERFLLLESSVQRPDSLGIDSKVTLNLSAEPPFDKFVALLRDEPRFQQSWDHTRKDLKDKSLSGYDMSLARFAYLNGWTAQEIVNLIIAHRRKYGDDVKLLRKDYLARILKRLAEDKRGFMEVSHSATTAGHALPSIVSDSICGPSIVILCR